MLMIQGSERTDPRNHCSIGYHPCHKNDLTMKAYPYKHNQEYKQEQEERNQNNIDHEVGSHKPMNNDIVR
jgi:hypothetical protein